MLCDLRVGHSVETPGFFPGYGFERGRFATLRDVVNHYDGFFRLGLTEQEKNGLIQYILGL
jgi:hypothetical protein